MDCSAARAPTPHHAAFLDAARAIVGPSQVLERDLDGYLTDWRGKYKGDALAVLRPASTEEVSALVRACGAHGIGIVPQGGNTGLCGGSVPTGEQDQVVVSLARMNRVLGLDTANNTLTAQAGCVLQTLQETAREAGRLFPLSLGAQGSCQIGGNISTNAGGVQVMRYGNTRELLLGLEVVLPSGEVLDLLRGLRKDNTGYDLKQLFIGAEGTLGIVTAATLKVFPAPVSTCVTWSAIASVDKVVRLLEHMRARFGERLTAFEIMSAPCVAMIHRHFPDSPQPLAGAHPWFVLMQVDGSEPQATLEPLVEDACGSALESGLVENVALASSRAQAQALWLMRENVADAGRREGPDVKHDISMPISAIPGFLDALDAALAGPYPQSAQIVLGHVGDGNLHLNVRPWPGCTADDVVEHTSPVNAIVHDLVVARGGSISAEHGIGQARRDELAHYKTPAERATMRAIKQALDPQGLMNPGKLLDGIDRRG